MLSVSGRYRLARGGKKEKRRGGEIQGGVQRSYVKAQVKATGMKKKRRGKERKGKGKAR